METLYQRLGVSPLASAEEIKAAYKRLAKQHHPDRSPQDEETFKLVSEAYAILSDAGKRASYDLWLQYQQFQRSYNTYIQPQPTPRAATSRPIRRPVFTKSFFAERMRTERIARKWIFIILMLLVGGTSVYTYIDQQEQEATQQAYRQQREAVFEQIEQLYAAEKFAEAFQALDCMQEEHPALAKDIEQLRTTLTRDLLDRSTLAFEHKRYKKALTCLLPLWKQPDAEFTESMSYILAACYLNTGQMERAISAFEDMLVRHPNSIRAYLELANLYEQELQRPDLSMRYLDIAVNLTISQYQHQYGPAFAAILSPTDVPDEHYLLYAKRAAMLAKKKYYRSALRDCNWAEVLRPDAHGISYLKGLCLYELGEKDEACAVWRQENDTFQRTRERCF